MRSSTHARARLGGFSPDFDMGSYTAKSMYSDLGMRFEGGGFLVVFLNPPPNPYPGFVFLKLCIRVDGI